MATQKRAQLRAVDDGPLDQLMTPTEVGELTGLTLSFLAQMRHQDRGPAWHKLSGKAVRYERRDVRDWIKSNRHEPAS